MEDGRCKHQLYSTSDASIRQINPKNEGGKMMKAWMSTNLRTTPNHHHLISSVPISWRSTKATKTNSLAPRLSTASFAALVNRVPQAKFVQGFFRRVDWKLQNSNGGRPAVVLLSIAHLTTNDVSGEAPVQAAAKLLWAGCAASQHQPQSLRTRKPVPYLAMHVLGRRDVF